MKSWAESTYVCEAVTVVDAPVPGFQRCGATFRRRHSKWEMHDGMHGWQAVTDETRQRHHLRTVADYPQHTSGEPT